MKNEIAGLRISSANVVVGTGRHAAEGDGATHLEARRSSATRAPHTCGARKADLASLETRNNPQQFEGTRWCDLGENEALTSR